MASSLRELLPFGFLLLSSIIGVVQYCNVLAFGQTLDSLSAYYHISKEAGDNLYTATTFGACAMSFVAGVLFDRWGPLRCCIVATVAGVVPPLLQLAWGRAVPGLPDSQLTLTLCYIVYGFGATTFNIIGCFAPLSGFSEANIGKANTLVQVSLSLGISYQSWVFDKLKGGDETGSFMPIYLQYVAAFTAVSGVLSYLGLYAFCTSKVQEPIEAPDAEPLLKLLQNREFAWMALLFTGCVGFSFSFLDYEARIARVVGQDEGELLKIFGVLDGVARVAVNSPLDYTRGYRFGGPVAYISAALLVFAAGLLCLTVPPEPGASHLQAANALVALGYGGMMGMVTAALRLQFGTTHMGSLCGILYLMVSVAQPAWGFLTESPGCFGTGCYRQYCAFGAAAMAATATAGLLLLLSSPPSRQGLGDASKRRALLDMDAEPLQ